MRNFSLDNSFSLDVLCDKHGKEMSMYCFACEGYACVNCFYKNEVHHKHDFIHKSDKIVVDSNMNVFD
jgi:hypothetical protein